MNLVVLGGTQFLGRRIVEFACERGHDVTIFHRGTTAWRVPDGVVERFGDRTTQAVEDLAREPFDAVVDTSGYVAGAVERSARAFAGARRYAFVSTISAYRPPIAVGTNEESALEAERPDADAADPAAYGALKVACERVVRQTCGERATIVRPGLIVGRDDPTDRFTYWVERTLRGGVTLAPGSPRRHVQLIDAADLARFIVLRIERDDATAVYNATGPVRTMADVFGDLAASAPPAAAIELRWTDDEELVEAGVEPWVEMPLWIPGGDDFAGLMDIDCTRALDAGLQIRPLSRTIADIAAWIATLAPDRPRHAGLSAERERELLARFAA